MRRLARVQANRSVILYELARVAEGLGNQALLDLKAVSVRVSSAAKRHREKLHGNDDGKVVSTSDLVVGTPSSAVSLSHNTSASAKRVTSAVMPGWVVGL